MILARTSNNQGNRRKGVTLVELGLYMVAAIGLLMSGVFVWGEVQFRTSKTDLVRDIQEINSAADSWKFYRSNYTGVSMAVLCAEGQQGIGKKVCGGVGGSGANTNPFGGSYTIEVGANVSQKKATATNLPADRIKELADTLAPLTADECTSADGCGTLQVNGTTITMIL